MFINNILNSIKKNFRAYTMIFALIGIWLLFTLLSPDQTFISARNLSNLFRQMTIISILAVGMVLVIASGNGNIDLSVGSTTGFVSVMAAIFHVKVISVLLTKMIPGISQTTLGITTTIITILICLLIGVLIGVLEGAVIAYLGVPAFIVTLGGMLIFRGGVNLATLGKTISVSEVSLKSISQGYLQVTLGYILTGIVIILIFLNMFLQRKRKKEYGFEVEKIIFSILKASFFSVIVFVFVLIMNLYEGVQVPVIIMAVVALIFTYLSNNTKFGRYIFAIGGNKEAARLSGINIRRNVFKVFMLMGLLSGVAGIVLTARLGAGTTSGGQGFELAVIASCVIGGTSLTGGEGTIFGALIGALIMASLVNGMNLLNTQYYWQDIVQGLVLVLAVYVDVISKKTKS